MAFQFRDTYTLEMAQKRQQARAFEQIKQISTAVQDSIVFNQLQTANAAVQIAQENLASAPAQIASINALLRNTQSALQNVTGVDPALMSAISGLQDQLANTTDPAAIVQLQKQIAQTQAQLVAGIPDPATQQRLQQNINDLQNELPDIQSSIDALNNAKNAQQTLQLLSIKQAMSANEQVNGKNPKLTAEQVAAKFLVVKTVNPNIDPLQFTEEQIRLNPPKGLVANVQSATTKAANAAARFKSIVEGRPDGQQAAQESRDPFAIMDPAVCGLIALDNEGSILADTSFNIPFQYFMDEHPKDSKSSSWESVSPMGRFEPYKIYTGGEPYTIALTLAYYAYDSGANTDEGAVQELKDKWLASQYPIYGKNQVSGVRSYGSPSKYLLNMFSRYINIPVIVTGVSIEQEWGYDPATWLCMGFKLSVTLETQFRMSQIISGDDIVKNGLRTYSHRQF